MGEARPSLSSCGDGFTCLLFLGVHGTVRLQVDETTLQQSKSKEEISGKSLAEGLGPPLKITALPLSVISIDGGLTGYIAPSNLGYSVMGSENSQFPRYIDAFKRMVEHHACLTSSEIARFFYSFDDKMYSYFDSFNKQKLHDLQTRFLARAPQDQEGLEKVNFTEKFLTFASDEMLKHDFNTRMQMNRVSAGLYWRQHDSCIAEKLYCPGTHANKCSLYFPGVGPVHDQLASKIGELQKQSRLKKPCAAGDAALCSDVSIEISSDKKLVLTITFETGDGGVVKNNLWEGITLNMFFEQIKRYLKFIFQGVEGFDGLMSRTCVIDTACSNFSVSVPGQHVSIIGFDNAAAGRGAVGASMIIDIHNDPIFEMGWWERMINSSSGSAVGAGAVTHSRHRLIIPRDLVSYVPSCLVCDNTIKSVEPIIDETTGQLSVVYTYRNGLREPFVRKPSSSGAVAVVTDSMGAVQDDDSQPGYISGGDLGGGGRKPLHTTRRVRSLRNKSKTKRSNKIRGFRRRGVRRTRRKRTRRTLRR